MSKRTSVDVGRLAAALQRPGIDSREWLTRARVMELGFDANNGLFADVQFLPGGEIETCLVGTGYAGNGFGAYGSLKVDDVVLVAVPQGDPGEGPIIIARLWNAGDKPPPELAQGDNPANDEPTANPTFRLEDGSTLRVVARNAGLIKLELSGGSTFEVVATEGSNVVVAADTTVEITGSAQVSLSSDAVIVSEAQLVKIGEGAVRGVARLQDLTIAGTGATGMLTALATSATADAAAWAAVGAALPPVSAAATAAAAAATALATAASTAAAAWGVINTASAKGLCE
jgi:hypothetical protein